MARTATIPTRTSASRERSPQNAEIAVTDSGLTCVVLDTFSLVQVEAAPGAAVPKATIAPSTSASVARYTRGVVATNTIPLPSSAAETCR